MRGSGVAGCDSILLLSAIIDSKPIPLFLCENSVDYPSEQKTHGKAPCVLEKLSVIFFEILSAAFAEHA